MNRTLKRMDDEKEIKLVEQYLSSLTDEELKEFPILPKCKYCIRLEFDIYRLYKYGLTLKSIVEKLNVFRDCSYIVFQRYGIIDIFLIF